MKHSMVIAQVGKGSYGETHYQKRDADGLGEIINTRYSFEAVIRECFKGQSMDVLHLVLVGTHDSAWNALLNYYSSGKTDVTGSEEKCSEEEFENRLAGLLQQRFEIVNQSKTESDEKLQIKRVIIEQGQSGEELRSNFAALQKAVDDVRETEKKETDWDIYFDISNGFRSFPIYIYTLINYLSQTESGKTRCHMFYGMFDSKIIVKEETEKEEEITPLVDLQFIDDLLLLTNAVSEFQNCGSVKQILEILKIHDEWNIVVGKRTENDKEVDCKLSEAFEMFDYGTNADNLAAIEIGVNLLKNMRSKIVSAESLQAAEQKLLLGIADDFSDRFSYEDKHNKYSYLMIKLAEWFHSNGREGNAAIMLQETMLTYLIERYPDLSENYMVSSDQGFSGSITDLQNLFDYKIRNKVREVFSNLKGIEEYKNFYIPYTYNSKNIRNVMAHSLYSDLKIDNKDNKGDNKKDCEELEELVKILYGDSDLEHRNILSIYKRCISYLLENMLQEIKNAEAEEGEQIQEVSNDLPFGFSFEKVFSAADITHIGIYKKMLHDVDTPIENEDDEDVFLVNLEKLRQQLQMRRGKEFDDFYEKKDEFDLLFQVYDKWITVKWTKDGPEVVPIPAQITREKYKQYFESSKTKKGRKTGWERLINTMNDRADEITGMLEGKEI